MARRKVPGTAGPERTNTARPYTAHMKKTYAFATAQRTVKTGGAAEKLSNYEIMERKLFEAGLAGKTLAQREFMRNANIAEEARRIAIEEECTIWERIKAHHSELHERARKTKSPSPTELPHPDDILIDWNEGVRIAGPITEVQRKRYDGLVKFRDALLVQHAMEDALNGVPAADRPSCGWPFALAVFQNDALPPSLQVSKYELIVLALRLSRVPKRDLLKQCRTAWRAAGSQAPRGKRLGTLETLQPMLKAILALTEACVNQEDDPLVFEEAACDAADAIVVFAASSPDAKARKTSARITEDAV